MTAFAPDSSPLAPTWAFVVRLREGTSFEPAKLRGRIEHIATGAAGDFDSLDGASAFMQRVMQQRGSTRA